MNLGTIYTTASISGISAAFNDFVMSCLSRQEKNDYGDTCEEDKISNDYALKNGGRILSVYNIPAELGVDEKCIWIITYPKKETTVLFPFEY